MARTLITDTNGLRVYRNDDHTVEIESTHGLPLRLPNLHFADLADVDMAGVSDDDLVGWDASAGKFVPKTPSAGGGTPIEIANGGATITTSVVGEIESIAAVGRNNFMQANGPSGASLELTGQDGMNMLFPGGSSATVDVNGNWQVRGGPGMDVDLISNNGGTEFLLAGAGSIFGTTKAGAAHDDGDGGQGQDWALYSGDGGASTFPDGSGGRGGDYKVTLGAGGAKTVGGSGADGRHGQFIISGLPASDPGVAGALYSGAAGALFVSAG
jgi:hypothetical protein